MVFHPCESEHVYGGRERSTSEYILAKNLSRVGFVVNDLIAKEAVGSTREHTCAAKVERMNVNIVEKTLRT
jgi:hypothetical protein